MDLEIRYPNGHMIIRTEGFFPTSEARIRKLNKTVRLDDRWDEEYNLPCSRTFWKRTVKALKDELEDRNEQLQALRKIASRTYDTMCDCKHLAKDKKTPAGLPLSKAEVEEARKKAKRMTEEFRRATKEAHQVQRRMDGLKNDIDFIKTEILP